jgi:hypothetical protein
VWKPGEIDYFVDGTQVTVHTHFIPSTAAHFIFNFWGTNSADWGGATLAAIVAQGSELSARVLIHEWSFALPLLFRVHCPE